MMDKDVRLSPVQIGQAVLYPSRKVLRHCRFHFDKLTGFNRKREQFLHPLCPRPEPLTRPITCVEQSRTSWISSVSAGTAYGSAWYIRKYHADAYYQLAFISVQLQSAPQTHLREIRNGTRHDFKQYITDRSGL